VGIAEKRYVEQVWFKKESPQKARTSRSFVVMLSNPCTSAGVKSKKIEAELLYLFQSMLFKVVGRVSGVVLPQDAKNGILEYFHSGDFSYSFAWICRSLRAKM
jgi:hypothetical protein